ncbi:hypothetical protein ACIRRA_21705 [Nocardia sp. NPDC101769]|uniref:hypothetical protein n=1 Tax=Nocardia sp. NPDC101769 TaxID=3364333 RepID=UPI003824BB3B
MGELAVAPSIVIKYADKVEQMSLTVVRAPTAGNAHFHGVPGTTSTGANVAAALRITPDSGLHGCAPVPAAVDGAPPPEVCAVVPAVVTAVGAPACAAVLAVGPGRAPDPPLSPHPAAPPTSTSAASPIPTFRTTIPTFRTTSSLRSTPVSPQRDTACFPPPGNRSRSVSAADTVHPALGVTAGNH